MSVEAIDGAVGAPIGVVLLLQLRIWRISPLQGRGARRVRALAALRCEGWNATATGDELTWTRLGGVSAGLGDYGSVVMSSLAVS